MNAPDPTYDGHPGGCNSYIKRATLAEDMTGLYVCLGTHRRRESNYRCGYASDCNCASWGCETTGDAWWKPSSSWDYITLRRKYLPKYLQSYLGIKTGDPLKSQCTSSWCIPLLINFTENGRKENWATRGFEWGLRLRECDSFNAGSCQDPGLLFKIVLSKTLPSKATVAVGPNIVLGGEKEKDHIPNREMGNITPSLYPTAFIPTLPPSRPTSTEVILQLVNATVQAIHNSSQQNYDECWICFSPVPPLYEGIVVF